MRVACVTEAWHGSGCEMVQTFSRPHDWTFEAIEHPPIPF